MKSTPFLASIISSVVTCSQAFSVSNYGTPKMAVTNLQMSSTAQETETNNPRLEGLALDLDSGTRKSHSVAQNSAFVTGFFKGLSTKEAYGALLTSLYFVYTAMEESFDQTNEDGVKAMDDKELRRVESLRKDLKYFYGPEWMDKLVPSPATQKYVARVNEIAEKQPYLLVAHQYTRYLGDLFGGRMMQGMAIRSLKLDEGKGVAFYTFDDIPSANLFITDWYSRLNELDLTDDQKQEIVDEANLVFDLNIGILEELDGSAATAFWSLVWSTLKEKIGL